MCAFFHDLDVREKLSLTYRTNRVVKKNTKTPNARKKKNNSRKFRRDVTTQMTEQTNDQRITVQILRNNSEFYGRTWERTWGDNRAILYARHV